MSQSPDHFTHQRPLCPGCQRRHARRDGWACPGCKELVGQAIRTYLEQITTVQDEDTAWRDCQKAQLRRLIAHLETL